MRVDVDPTVEASATRLHTAYVSYVSHTTGHSILDTAYVATRLHTAYSPILRISLSLSSTLSPSVSISTYVCACVCVFFLEERCESLSLSRSLALDAAVYLCDNSSQ
jgi:hypothetical protein